MANFFAFVLLGLLAVISADEAPMTYADLSPEARSLYDFVVALDFLEAVMSKPDKKLADKEKSFVPKIVQSTTTAAPSTTPVTPSSTTTETTPVKKHTSYHGLCVKILEKKEKLEKHPEFKAIESKLMSYVNEILNTFMKHPERKDEVIHKVISELIDLLEKLKAIFAKKSKPSRPTTTASPTEEIVAEQNDDSMIVGSIRGIPGIHFPNYTEVPITSFSCGGKKYIPGFYADTETRCQVFHVCYKHRRESFLCPIGTTFNQAILACDYWYSSNCSLSSQFFDVNDQKVEDVKVPEESKKDIKTMITTLIEQEKPLPHIQVKSKESGAGFLKSELEQLLRFLPIKAKILEFPTKADIKIPVAQPVVVPIVKPVVPKVVPVVKAKVAAKVPLLKTLAAVPVVKAKVAPALKLKGAAKIVPVAKAVVAPALKVKTAAKLVPVAKAAVAPALKVKAAAKLVPVAKAAVLPKVAAIPLKAKAVLSVAPLKVAAISPLTKKALALGYVKLLKAKKLAVMG